MIFRVGLGGEAQTPKTGSTIWEDFVLYRTVEPLGSGGNHETELFWQLYELNCLLGYKCLRK